MPQYRQLGAYTDAVDGRLLLARSVGCQRVIAHVEDDWTQRVLRSRGLEILDATKRYLLSL